MRPSIYYGNLFAEGTLSGGQDTTTNPVRRVADGSVNLDYSIMSGGAVTSGWVAVAMGSGVVPDALVFPKCSIVSGHMFSLESEDLDQSNRTTVLSYTASGTLDRLVLHLSGGETPRRVWRLWVSGVSGLDAMTAREVQLATRLQFPRSVEVGVGRTLVRQFTRLPIPGGQPYTKRDGPALRRTRWTFSIISGSEVSGMQTWVRAVEGGSSFTVTDDLGDTYWSELLGPDQPFSDRAGVYGVDMTIQEVRAD